MRFLILNPKKPFAVLRLFFLVTAYGLLTLHADSIAQTDFSLIRKFEHPDGIASRNDHFGEEVTVVGGNVLISARDDDVSGPDAGAAYLFDRQGNLLTTFLNPSPQTSDGDVWFGNFVEPLGDDRVLIAAPLYDGGRMLVDTGIVYVFDLEGNLIKSIGNPTPFEFDEFGKRQIATNGHLIAIAAWKDETQTPGTPSGAAYLYDSQGNLLQEFFSPHAGTTANRFGRALTFVGDDKLLVSDLDDNTGNEEAGAAFLFDLQGNLLQTFLNPTPLDQTQEAFGTTAISVGDRIVIGAAREGSIEQSSGAAYIYDLEGNLLKTIHEPEPTFMNLFGWSGAPIGDDRFIISSVLNDDLANGAGKAYLYDLEGNLLHTFVSPEPGIGQHFGRSFTTLEDDILISEEAGGPGSTGFGAVYMFQPIGMVGDADFDGEVGLEDFDILKRNFGTGDRFRHGDFDLDEQVGLTDFALLKDNFGAVEAVPEPSGWMLALVAACGGWLLRRRAS